MFNIKVAYVRVSDRLIYGRLTEIVYKYFQSFNCGTLFFFKERKEDVRGVAPPLGRMITVIKV